MRYFIMYLRATYLHLHTRKLNDTFISRMYMNYYDDICDNPHEPLTNFPGHVKTLTFLSLRTSMKRQCRVTTINSSSMTPNNYQLHNDRARKDRLTLKTQKLYRKRK